MTDLATSNQEITSRPRTDWGAIWGGVFTFAAIWFVFGMLGIAIFASAGNPKAGAAVTGMSVGMGIWAIVLSIIAMYFAGLETGRLAAVTNRHDGMIHGIIMFGLSVLGGLMIAILAGGTGVEGSMRGTYLADLFSGWGWVAFLSLFLGWLAAMGGAASGASRKTDAAHNVREIRTAA